MTSIHEIVALPILTTHFKRKEWHLQQVVVHILPCTRTRENYTEIRLEVEVSEKVLKSDLIMEILFIGVIKAGTNIVSNMAE